MLEKTAPRHIILKTPGLTSRCLIRQGWGGAPRKNRSGNAAGPVRILITCR
jgi:hypothetical protein